MTSLSIHDNIIRVAAIIVSFLWGTAIGVAEPLERLPPIGDDRVAGETVPALEESLAESLDDAWRTAMTADQRIAASRWNVTSAASTAAAARAERFASLKLSTEYYALSDQPSFVANLPAPLPTLEMPFLNSNGAALQAMVNQPLYTFGRISHGINAAEESVRAYEAESGRTILDVKINVAEIYITVLRTRRLVEVADSRASSLEAHARDVGNFFDKGMVPQNDLLSAQVALSNARQDAMQVHNSLLVANAAYNRALGRALDTPVNLAEVQPAEFSGDVDELTEQALRLRPEIAAFSSQTRALREQAASLRAKRAPQVALGGGFLYLEDQSLDPNGLGVIGIGVEWTPIDAGRTSHQAAALVEKAEASVRLCRDAQSLIALDVRQKWLDLQTALHRVETVRQARTQADENLRVARDRYQHQVGTNTEVLDAESLRLQAYVNFYNATYEVLLANMRLRRAVGNL
jgi:outer membrane protein